VVGLSGVGSTVVEVLCTLVEVGRVPWVEVAVCIYVEVKLNYYYYAVYPFIELCFCETVASYI